jgi:thymidylate synthase
MSKDHEEHQYLSLIRTVISTGEIRSDRTGTGTLALFAPQNLRFSLKDNTLPLVTTKRTFLRGIIAELLWFVHGSTDAKLLSNQGVKIWDGNGSLEFLKARGLVDRREGDLGPVYGFQWRHFGARYTDCESGYQGEGVDQLADVIRKIRKDPMDRRIILSAWNPQGGRPRGLYTPSSRRTYGLWSADIPLMALPPCHLLCQFSVSLPPAGSLPDGA